MHMENNDICPSGALTTMNLKSLNTWAQYVCYTVFCLFVCLSIFLSTASWLSRRALKQRLDILLSLSSDVSEKALWPESLCQIDAKCWIPRQFIIAGWGQVLTKFGSLIDAQGFLHSSNTHKGDLISMPSYRSRNLHDSQVKIKLPTPHHCSAVERAQLWATERKGWKQLLKKWNGWLRGVSGVQLPVSRSSIIGSWVFFLLVCDRSSCVCLLEQATKGASENWLTFHYHR